MKKEELHNKNNEQIPKEESTELNKDADGQESESKDKKIIEDEKNLSPEEEITNNGPKIEEVD